MPQNEPKNTPGLEKQLPLGSSQPGLQRMVQRLSQKLSQDELVYHVIEQLRQELQSDRVVLYYFYRRWRGQVTFESLSDASLSIVGMTGADDCFNQDYAQMYLEGRVKATADVDAANLRDCHLEFLHSIQVKANLVVPVLTKPNTLWGLLVAHQCRGPRVWTEAEMIQMQAGATQLALSPNIGSESISH